MRVSERNSNMFAVCGTQTQVMAHLDPVWGEEEGGGA